MRRGGHEESPGPSAAAALPLAGRSPPASGRKSPRGPHGGHSRETHAEGFGGRLTGWHGARAKRQHSRGMLGVVVAAAGEPNHGHERRLGQLRNVGGSSAAPLPRLRSRLLRPLKLLLGSLEAGQASVHQCAVQRLQLERLDLRLQSRQPFVVQLAVQGLQLLPRRLSHLHVKHVVLHDIDRHLVLLHPRSHTSPPRHLFWRDLGKSWREGLVLQQKVAQLAAPQQQQGEERVARAGQVEPIVLKVHRARLPLQHLLARLAVLAPAAAACSIGAEPLVHLATPLASTAAADGARLAMRDAERERARAGRVARGVQPLDALGNVSGAAPSQVIRARHEQHMRVAALFEQPAQAVVARLANVDIRFTVEAVEHLRRRPAAHANVVDGHTECVCQTRRPRGVGARVLGQCSVAG
eukprot:5074532-Prymnesium_polylepis.1